MYMFKMLNPIDKFLNNITMYRLVLYVLSITTLVAFVGSALGLISYSLLGMFGSLATLLVVCYVTNYLCAVIVGAPQNVESVYITAYILFLILLPIDSVQTFSLVAATAFLSIISKYILAIKKWHLFNPAAIALVIMSALGSGIALWWVATPVLLPFTLIGGLLIVRKIRRSGLFLSFFIVSSLFIISHGLIRGELLPDLLKALFLSWPIIYFGTVMLTEPLTTPPTNGLQIVYGTIVGLFFGSQFHLGPFYSAPELALVLGNVYSYIVGTKQNVILSLVSKRSLTEFVQEFVFKPNQKLAFEAGQYGEWTIGSHDKIDSRGNRRYFTVASSPNSDLISLAVRIEGPHGENGSTFKKDLVSLKEGDTMMMSRMAGNFTLPKVTPLSQKQTLVFIAGGIGVTPFKSMIDFLVEQKRKTGTCPYGNLVMLYAANTEKDFAYMDEFEKAKSELGMKVVYIPSKKSSDQVTWNGYLGYLNETILKTEVPQIDTALFYLSGPQAMVENYKHLIKSIGISPGQIKTDYFPGF